MASGERRAASAVVTGARNVPAMVTATVREWREEEGWGVLDCPETPGGCWGHYSTIEMAGFRTLAPGQRVDIEWEAPGFQQDGYDCRAVRIVPRSGPDG
ncbi:hypothetical protein GCM10027074_42130 [Streptomyces deserti]